VFNSADEVLELQALLPAPDFVIARKQKHYWQVQERVFDYRGSYRKANKI
jgi:DNA repair protein RadD